MSRGSTNNTRGKPKYHCFARKGLASGKSEYPCLEWYGKKVGCFPERETFKGICKKQGKGMSGVPTVIYNVQRVRNMGLPTGRESYGNGVPIVVDGVTPIQGDGNAVYRAKWNRQVTDRYYE